MAKVASQHCPAGDHKSSSRGYDSNSANTRGTSKRLLCCLRMQSRQDGSGCGHRSCRSDDRVPQAGRATRPAQTKHQPSQQFGRRLTAATPRSSVLEARSRRTLAIAISCALKRSSQAENVLFLVGPEQARPFAVCHNKTRLGHKYRLTTDVISIDSSHMCSIGVARRIPCRCMQERRRHRSWSVCPLCLLSQAVRGVPRQLCFE